MTTPMPTALPDSLLLRLSGFIASQVGLHFPRERWRDLERGIIAASREAGYAKTEAYAQWLLAAPLAREHIEGLASHLTVGETYFFREKTGLDILERQILPELLHARASSERYLRIWCAGCCTGEEPYSIAIILHRLIPDLEKWNVTLLATDISPRFLRMAAQGAYGAWSFRNTPDSIKELYFTKRQDGRFVIASRIRRMVTFSCLNLAEDVYPSPVNNTHAMDVILCRNVLIYFAEDSTRMVIDRLRRSLIDGGWLLTSPAETSTQRFSALTTVEFPGAFLYRNIAQVKRPAAAARKQAPRNEMEAPQPRTLTLAKPSEPEYFSMARTCADEGSLAEAIEWCEKAIAADKLNPAHHYLHAVICQEQGQIEKTERSLGRAIYLDPDFALAHFALGNLCLSGGRRQEAQRHFGNALTLLRNCPADARLQESDGLTAGRLIEIIDAVQASLTRSRKELIA